MSKEIVSAMFDVIEWKHEELAFIDCPGKHLHTGKNAKRDCRVNLDKAPTLFCLHSSCSVIVEEANFKMRRAIWERSPMAKREFTPEERIKIKKDLEEKREESNLREWASKNKSKLIGKYSWPIADVFHESPVTSEDPGKEMAFFVSKMYKLEDIIWNGNVTDSGIGHEKNFQEVGKWVKDGIKGNFTCPSTFKDGTYSRSNEQVLNRPYLVMESDSLTPDETCSLYKWLQKSMKLKAIVSTGGKSMHGWFVFPSEKMLKALKVTLPELGFDEALFKASQPVRMPGVMRGDKLQCLYYFNP